MFCGAKNYKMYREKFGQSQMPAVPMFCKFCFVSHSLCSNSLIKWTQLCSNATLSTQNPSPILSLFKMATTQGLLS